MAKSKEVTLLCMNARAKVRSGKTYQAELLLQTISRSAKGATTTFTGVVEMRSPSIMQDSKKCLVTGAEYGLDCHKII